MSFYFIGNNIHFALELIGALVFFVMTWLAFDAYAVSRHYSSLLRGIGFLLIGVWQIIYAASFGSDLINFTGFFVYLFGLIILSAGIVATPRLATVSAVILIPSFTSSEYILQLFAAALLGGIALLVYKQAKEAYDTSARPLWIGFVLLAISALVQVMVSIQQGGIIGSAIVSIIKTVAFFSFAYWVWQYLRMRIRESLILIFISMTLFIATIVTLAFSIILITNIEQETRNNLLINARVFDFSVQGLTKEAQAQAGRIAVDPAVESAVVATDMTQLQLILDEYAQKSKLGFLLITDKSGVVVLRANAPLQYGDTINTERAVEEALIGNTFSTIEFSPAESLSIRASAPLYSEGAIIGTVIAGFPLDNAMVDGIKKITGLDTTFYEGSTVVATTTLAPDGRSRLTGASLDDKTIQERVLVGGETLTSRVVLHGVPYLASYIPVKNGDGAIIGMFSAAKQQDDIIEIANNTNRLTLGTVTILLLLLSFPIYLLTRKLIGSAI